jgi:prepilin-type N-terminal cleavage/methylation domain-containing protein
MRKTTRNRRPRAAQRLSSSGFTLIEVMIVLALTLVMMSLFATIFTMTGTFVTKQKGIGENDQSARILTTVLKTDLEARTMRFLAPFHPNMSALGDDSTNRLGFFYVSENDPTDDTDDVLQFTINLGAPGLKSLNNPSAGTTLYGNGICLVPPWQPTTTYAVGAVVRPSTTAGNTTGFAFKNEGTGSITTGAAGNEPNWPTVAAIGGTIADPSGSGTWTAIAFPLDQPDGDDGMIAFGAGTPASPTLDPINGSPNNAAASQYAEVSYFLRNGNLYRRVLLLRQPYDPSTGAQTPQPNDGTGAYLIPGAYPPYPTIPALPTGYSGNFWTDFDYSARINTGSPGVLFLAFSPALNSLDNNTSATAPGPQIGLPYNRFGFDQNVVTTGTTLVANGAPREFAFMYNSATPPPAGAFFPTGPMFFFGRYTQEETSNVNFQFPGKLPTVGGTPVSPMASTSLLALDANNSTMWMLDANPPVTPLSLAGGPRRGEDILLTNVISFDVKLWDPNYSEVPTGGGAAADVNRNGVIDSGPGGFADVGHTAPFGDFQQSHNVFPVYGPQSMVATGYTVPAPPTIWTPGTPTTWTRTFDGITYNYNNVFDTWYRWYNFDNQTREYDTNAADTNLFAPAPYRPTLGKKWQPGTAYTVGQTVDPTSTANGYTYVCVVAGTSGATDPFSLSDVVVNPAGNINVPPGIADGTTGLVWNAQPPVAVKAIQITVKYLDPTQNFLRQVTIVQSLTQ